MGEDCILFLMFCSSRARLSCPLFFSVSDKKERRDGEGGILEDRRWGGWVGMYVCGGGGGRRDGGAADMHLSPISSNALHNSSALSLLPRLRTIRPDAH